MPLVLDASAIVTLALADEDSALAEAALERLASAGGGLVPPLFWYEVANVLLVTGKAARVTPEASIEFLADLLSLPISLDLPPHPIEAFALGMQYGLFAYDAAYLEIALRTGSELATLDAKLAAAAEKAGVTLLSVQ